MKFFHPFFLILVWTGLILGGCVVHPDDSTLLIMSEEKPVSIQVEVVTAGEGRQKGLMGRNELPEGRGMLFVFEDDPQPTMWMKNMLISLDMLFIGRDLKINHIAESVPPCRGGTDSECLHYRSQEPSPYVLELPAGYAVRAGLKTGHQVILPSGL